MRSLAVKFKKVLLGFISVQVRLILGIFYFVLMAPLGLFITVFKDYLGIRSAPAWKKRGPVSAPADF
ncbi:MAG: hypothetical protein M0R35_05130, partial [Candidatus Omnitrophica bacterium]|nr:hypothetical protein [Candidatus Omnitrophota bacterium]